MKTCSVEGCDTRARTRGLCRSHYERLLRNGTTDYVRPFYTKGTSEERFWAKVDKQGPNECWEWLAGKDAYGYGIFTIPREGTGRYYNILAHRYSYILHGGDLPLIGVSGVDEQTIDHVVCQNRACVNPAHMEVVPLAENSRRMALATRVVPAEEVHAAVAALIERGVPVRPFTLAQEMGVSKAAGRRRLIKHGYWEGAA